MLTVALLALTASWNSWEDCNFIETPDFFKKILRGYFGLQMASEVKSDLIIGFLLVNLPHQVNFMSLGHPHGLFKLVCEIKKKEPTVPRPASWKPQVKISNLNLLEYEGQCTWNHSNCDRQRVLPRTGALACRPPPGTRRTWEWCRWRWAPRSEGSAHARGSSAQTAPPRTALPGPARSLRTVEEEQYYVITNTNTGWPIRSATLFCWLSFGSSMLPTCQFCQVCSCPSRIR